VAVAAPDAAEVAALDAAAVAAPDVAAEVAVAAPDAAAEVAVAAPDAAAEVAVAALDAAAEVAVGLAQAAAFSLCRDHLAALVRPRAIHPTVQREPIQALLPTRSSRLETVPLRSTSDLVSDGGGGRSNIRKVAG
jgi:hypothetical protein